MIVGLPFAILSHYAFADSPDVTASGDTITAHHRYTMGDNDSKSDATTICFLEAKRKAVEYAGSYVESEVNIDQTEKSRKAKSKVKTIAASLVSSEIVSVDTGLDNGKVFVDCVVNVKADKNQLKKDVAKISANPAANKQIEQQQIQLKKLEDEILKIQSRLSSASGQQAVLLRRERTAVFKNIDKLQEKKLEIVSHIESKGRDASELIETGMNKKDVISLLGERRAENRELIADRVAGKQVLWWRDGWNYGTHWVHFRDGIVICVSTYSQGCN
ncbi:MAG: hypothetical protein Q8O24_04625 [Gallionellaceae bacterium]|nr:hypothetical protein [Gallionellaceae bacterium]